MNQQEFYRNEYRKIKPDWVDSMSLYRNAIDSYTSAETKLLDVGCGHGDFLKSIHDKTKYSFGVDPDKTALDKNKFIKNLTVAEVEKLPFEDNFFDLIVLAWVVEHLPDPQKAFQEMYRVLKPGGKIVFLTPNAWNYNVWIIRIIPEIFHDFFTKKLYGRQENDTYPKKYLMNSIPRIKKTLGQVGFSEVKLILNSDPSYISFNNFLFAIACFIENILELKFLNSMKVHFIGIFEKNI